MKKILILSFLSVLCLPGLSQPQAAYQDSVPAVNYDKSKIWPYVLEDPLRFVDGSAVETAGDWERRRTEILDIFQHEMYGVLPPASPIFLEEFESGTTLSGFGYRRQVRMWFREDHTGPKIDWLIVTPTHVKGPVPAVILLNSFGNQSVLDDPQIRLTDCWLRNKPDIGIENFHATEKTRGFYVGEQFRSTFPVASILARGYALVTACYGEVSPDPERVPDGNGVLMQDSFAYTGVFDLWGRRDPSRMDNTSSLMAWAWSLMRGMDMIGQDPYLDGTRVVVTGASRLAKAALLAAAYDTRFPVVVPVQCGGGGVKLAKRNYGESIAAETFKFRHWYCRAYDKYAGNEDKMPFDQHLLVASIAPRSILVEGFGSPWFDTEGEYLSVKAADPVWKKLGFEGIQSEFWPDVYDTSAIGDRLGYVRRDQLHGISPVDWQWMLDFADKTFEAQSQPKYILHEVEAPFAMDPIKEFVFPKRDFRIDMYGAIADSTGAAAVEINTRAVARAMRECSEAGGGRVVVPAGKWHIGPIHFRSRVDLHLEEGAVLCFSDRPEDYLPEVRTSWEGMECMNYSPLVYAYGCSDIAITGSGTLAPEMGTWSKWFDRPEPHLEATRQLYHMASTDVPVEQRHMAEGENNLRPHLIQFNRCSNVLLDGFKIRESPFWTIHIYHCDGGVARNLDVYAHGRNNDGIDLEMTRNFLVEDCTFDQGDDAVVIKSGRNRDAWRLDTPTENIVVRNCRVIEGHTLLGIGSEISGGVRNVYMHDCSVPDNVFRLLFIKTNHRRGGFVKDVWMENIDGRDMQRVFEIDTDVLYRWRDLVPTLETRITEIGNINVRNVHCTSTDAVYDLKGDRRKPVVGVRIENVRADKVREFHHNVKNVRKLSVSD